MTVDKMSKELVVRAKALVKEFDAIIEAKALASDRSDDELRKIFSACIIAMGNCIARHMAAMERRDDVRNFLIQQTMNQVVSESKEYSDRLDGEQLH